METMNNEMTENIEEALKRHAEVQEKFGQTNYKNKKSKARKLSRITGHPLYTFTKETKAVQEILSEEDDIETKLDKLSQVSIHYAKKGDLLYPHLKAQYGIAGPSDVLWTQDDEIRDEMNALLKEKARDEQWKEKAETVLRRVEEMGYKETNTIYPICAVNFTEEDWKGIYKDSWDYPECLGVSKEVWADAEEEEEAFVPMEGEVQMPGGHLTMAQLTALLNTLPMEITFIDENDTNCFFNEGPKVFKRPSMAIGRDVFSCHPPKIEKRVRAILNEFKEGTKDQVQIWSEKEGRQILVTYMAVRDKEGTYVGTVELVQDMEYAKEHFQKNI